MKVIVAGSRDLPEDWYLVEHAVNEVGWIIEEVVSGGARGIDRAGEQWAKYAGVPIKQFLAEWDTNGKAAGIIRNIDMAEYADALIAIWDGKSKGTLHMIQSMVSKKKPVYVYCPT